MAKVIVGQRIHYSGDMANPSGWFRVARIAEHTVDLSEIDGDGRKINGIQHNQIGDVYAGHCAPRFVTDKAYNAYYEKGE